MSAKLRASPCRTGLWGTALTKRLRRADARPAAPRLSAASPLPPGTGRPVRTGHAYLTAFLSAALLLLSLYAAPASASPEDNSLIVALERFPPGFNPAVASGSLTSQIGAQLFAGLVRTFVDKKIAQMQVNCLSSDVMRKAQQEPENYRDLIVRVVGYSANFVTLPPTVQDLVLEREEHPLNS